MDNCLIPDAQGIIHSVETAGMLDGPSIRYLLFLSGCPCRCLYCHNPDAMLRRIGITKMASECFEDIKRYKNFIKGLTISGGEPLIQQEFVLSLIKRCKEFLGLHIAIDTSGAIGSKILDEIYDYTDLFLLDIKSWDRSLFKKITSLEIDNTLEFAKELERRDKKIWLRFVLVPNLTDNEENITGLASFASSLKNIQRVEILPFHKMGEYKWRDLGLRYTLSDIEPPSQESIEKTRQIFRNFGLKVY